MFQPLVPNIEDNDLDALLETYMAFKMEPDGDAADSGTSDSASASGEAAGRPGRAGAAAAGGCWRPVSLWPEAGPSGPGPL